MQGGPEEINFGMLLLRTFFFLAIILVLIYFVLRKVLPLLVQAPAFRNRTVRIVERVAVDQKRSLLVVEIQERFYLLGSAEGQISMLMELDREKMDLQKSAAKSPSAFDRVFQKTILKTDSPENPKS